MSRGGITRSIRDLSFWCIILSILCLMCLASIKRIKANYTELHRRVRQLELKL